MNNQNINLDLYYENTIKNLSQLLSEAQAKVVMLGQQVQLLQQKLQNYEKTIPNKNNEVQKK